jgi:hypothetical protein
LTQIRNVKCQQVDGKKIEIYYQNYNVTGAMKIYLEERYGYQADGDRSAYHGSTVQHTTAIW